MTINHNGKCKGCTPKTPSTNLTEIGTQVHIQGGKEGDTTHTFYQCTSCGSIWIKIKDQGGLGGNGTFYHLLTRKYY